MSEQYQRVEPTKFDAPGEQPSAPVVEAPARPPWLIPAFAGLAVLALAVVFVLPQLIDDPEPRTPVASAGAGVDNAKSGTSRGQSATEPDARESAAASPFADAVEARARAEAQELLAELIDVREGLSERGAEVWAEGEMNAIAEAALAGDELYRERSFDGAIERYKEALADALALEQSLPERFAAQLALVDEGIEELDETAARTAFELAGLLQPGDPTLTELEARLASLATVKEAVEAAAQQEADNDLAAAVDSLQGALTLDDKHRFVKAERDRVAEVLRQQRFNAAMSEGYAALDTGNFDRAQQRFEAAAKLEPGSAEAAAALDELSVARTTATLNALQRRADGLVADEDWSSAVTVFEEALAIDGSLRFAREGLAIAKPRAALDKELTAILDKPERLVDDAILREAQAALARAEAAAPVGDRLEEQILRVRETLQIARTPLTVDLRSDGLTEVTVYKVARLGLFEARQLSLRPGKYTAVGSRRGYRDVRVVFTVSPEDNTPVLIACTELI